MTEQEFDLLPTPMKIATMLAPHVNHYHTETRGGSTGVGHTSESLIFDKGEDNHKAVDVYDAELKSCTSRKKNARIRLGTLTFINSLTGGPVGNDLLTNFGRIRFSKKKQSHEQAFTKSVNCKPKRPTPWASFIGKHTPILTLTGDRIVLDAGPVQAHIDRSTVEDYLKEKAPNLCVLKADTKKIETVKAYRYYAFDYFGGIDLKKFWQCVEDGLVTFEFRIQGRDRGCSINVNLNRFSMFYKDFTHWDGATNTFTQ